MSAAPGSGSPPAAGRPRVRVERVVLSREGAELVRMRGVLDERGFAVAREAMRGALSRRPDLVILDLKGVTRLDGAGLVLLAAMQQRARQSGSRISIVDRRRSGPRLPHVPVHATVGAALRAADRSAARQARAAASGPGPRA
jgi:ABC-type transporter Mla MlaB component